MAESNNHNLPASSLDELVEDLIGSVLSVSGNQGDWFFKVKIQKQLHFLILI